MGSRKGGSVMIFASPRELNQLKLQKKMLEDSIDRIIKDCWRAQKSPNVVEEVNNIRRFAQKVLCDVHSIR